MTIHNQQGVKQIRELLRAVPEGLTVLELSHRTQRLPKYVRGSLYAMPDAYIDRWTEGTRGYAAVWCVVVPPPNCPKPGERK